MIKIAPSILSANFSRLGEDVKEVERAGAEYLHIDIMDGHFVPNITIGPLVVASLRPISSMIFDVHLMIENPERYLEDFARAGADIITVHAESTVHLHRALQQIKKFNIAAGVALNPATSADVLEYVLPMADLVLVMTVNPGFGGQQFIPGMVEKIKVIKAMSKRLNPSVEIQVDGGIGPETAPLVAKAGAEVMVAGSAIFGAGDVAGAIKEIRGAAIAHL